MILIGAAAAGAWLLLRRKSGEGASTSTLAPFTSSGSSGASWGLPGALTGGASTGTSTGSTAPTTTAPKPSNFVGAAPAPAAKTYQGSFGGGSGYTAPKTGPATYDESTGVVKFASGNSYDSRARRYYYNDGSSEAATPEMHRRYMIVASGKPDPVYQAALALPK